MIHYFMKWENKLQFKHKEDADFYSDYFLKKTEHLSYEYKPIYYFWEWKYKLPYEKFMKVFDTPEDFWMHMHCDKNIWFINDENTVYINEAFLDECLEKGLKNDKAIEYYEENLYKK